LVAIGRKYFELLDEKNYDNQSTYSEEETNLLLKELMEWRTAQNEFDPIPDEPVVFLNMYSFWDSYMLMTYNFLTLIVLSKQFSRKIHTAPLHDMTLQSAYHHANHTTKLIRGQLMHNPQFDNMPVLTGKCVFISGVFLCAYGYRDPLALSNVNEHVTALHSIAQYASKTYLNVADQLAAFMSDPLRAIHFIQSL
jgi:hypothetical protein